MVGVLRWLFPLITASLVAAGPGTHNYHVPHSNYGNQDSNREHIQEHIRAMSESTGETPPPLTESNDVYYLFALHDTNGDGHLDGQELRGAFSDFISESGSAGFVSLEEVTEMVDHILEEDDVNGDGLISWEEYIQSELYHDTL